MSSSTDSLAGFEIGLPPGKKPSSYLFDLDLSADDPRDGRSRGQVPRAEHEAALAQARREAQEAGFAAGQKSAEAKAAEKLAGEVAHVAAALGQLLATADRDIERIRRDASELAMTVATTLARTLVARQPLAEIEALIAESLGPLRGTPHLVVRLRVGEAEAIRERLEAIADRAGFTGRLVILGEDDIRPGDCRVEWADGGIVRNMEQAITEISAAVARRFAGVGGLSCASDASEEQP